MVRCPDCGTTFAGMDCAFTLSRESGWRNKPGCVAMCTCGYPVRAKELCAFVFKSLMDSDKRATDPAYIYCEKGGQGHVYYGTYRECIRGNGYTAANMEPLTMFLRHASAR